MVAGSIFSLCISACHSSRQPITNDVLLFRVVAHHTPCHWLAASILKINKLEFLSWHFTPFVSEIRCVQYQIVCTDFEWNIKAPKCKCNFSLDEAQITFSYSEKILPRGTHRVIWYNTHAPFVPFKYWQITRFRVKKGNVFVQNFVNKVCGFGSSINYSQHNAKSCGVDDVCPGNFGPLAKQASNYWSTPLFCQKTNVRI